MKTWNQCKPNERDTPVTPRSVPKHVKVTFGSLKGNFGQMTVPIRWETKMTVLWHVALRVALKVIPRKHSPHCQDREQGWHPFHCNIPCNSPIQRGTSYLTLCRLFTDVALLFSAKQGCKQPSRLKGEVQVKDPVKLTWQMATSVQDENEKLVYRDS